MNRFVAIVAFFTIFLAACGVDRESEDTLGEDVVSDADQASDADGDGSDQDPAVEDGGDALTTTTLPPFTPPTTGAPGDVALTADFGDATWEITHGELNEVIVPTQENPEFVALVFGGQQPPGFDIGVLTEQLISRAVQYELDEIGGSISAEDLDASKISLLAQVETLFQGATDPSFEAERLYDEVPYLPFLVEYQAGQDALSAALAAAADGGQEVPCVRHILVDTQAEGDDIVVRLDGGEDFADLAIELSTGPSGPGGGDLGCGASSNYVPAFADAVDAADIGAYVGPVETEFGWHVILVERTEAAAVDGRALASEQLRARLADTSVDVDAKLGTWDTESLAILPLDS